MSSHDHWSTKDLAKGLRAYIAQLPLIDYETPAKNTPSHIMAERSWRSLVIDCAARLETIDERVAPWGAIRRVDLEGRPFPHAQDSGEGTGLPYPDVPATAGQLHNVIGQMVDGGERINEAMRLIELVQARVGVIEDTLRTEVPPGFRKPWQDDFELLVKTIHEIRGAPLAVEKDAPKDGGLGAVDMSDWRDVVKRLQTKGSGLLAVHAADPMTMSGAIRNACNFCFDLAREIQQANDPDYYNGKVEP